MRAEGHVFAITPERPFERLTWTVAVVLFRLEFVPVQFCFTGKAVQPLSRGCGRGLATVRPN
jgi:hypothetical protein